jgi:hypothetical protein
MKRANKKIVIVRQRIGMSGEKEEEKKNVKKK